MKKKTNWNYSIQTKLMLGFGVVIAIITSASLLIYNRVIELARQTTYEKMQSEASYYLEVLDNEIEHVRQLQIEFFNDRKLAFLVGPEINISDYEKRDCLLSVMERVYTIAGVSELIDSGIVYLPKSGYRITASRVSHMNSTDEAQVYKYLPYTGGDMYYDGESFFMVETGARRVQTDSVPNYEMVIQFSTAKIQERLRTLNASGDYEAFLYIERDNVMVEQNQNNIAGRKILENLATDEKGEYLTTQRVEVDGQVYLVFVGGRGALGLFVQYIQEKKVMGAINHFKNMVYLLLVLMIAMAVFFGIYSKWLVHKPMNTLLQAFQRIESGDWKQPIIHSRRDEFCYLYEGFNEMENQMSRLIEEVYVQTNLAQRAQLKQLQAQIAPHFLYNSFFILNRRIKRRDYENAEELARHLGTYFQYLTRNESDIVTLEQETEHARSYVEIQAARFVNRIAVQFDKLPEHFRMLNVPRLILQPMLENAFAYGLENKVRDGILKVSFIETQKEYLICIEDNGEDIIDEKIQELQEQMKFEKYGEVTALLNIHRRLQIFFKQRAGLRVLRSSLGGLCVTIFLEREAKDESKPVDCR